MHTSASGAGNQPIKVSQGDIIHSPSRGEADKPRWGFIVTADCDIAQDKAGARLSYLNVVPVHHYLEHVWAEESLRKLRTRALKAAAELLSSAAKLLDEGVDPLSPEDILQWLRDETADKITDALKVSEKKRKNYLDALEVIELIFNLRGAYSTALQRLKRIWAIKGANANEMRSRLEQALDYNKATDFHIIPEIPTFKSLGYVVLLRDVSSINHGDIHASDLDLRISGGEAGYYIVGSSNDNLRYAISQKMAFLFSRIGMSVEYEAQCEVVTELAVNDLCPSENTTRNAK